MNIIIANIVALIASIIMVSIGLIKKKKRIIYYQTIQIGLFVVSNILLGASTGIIINSISCVRNILCYKNKLDKKNKIIIIILSVVTSLLFNNKGIIGLLPLISSVVYIIYMNIKDVVKFKYILIFTLLLWFVYDFYIMSYTSALFDLISAISAGIGIYQVKNKRKV
ncbi:MAG: YgjV family protein [Firmicutes bacterium]|nr:YgjV family protein [Bacillota bacterium]